MNREGSASFGIKNYGQIFLCHKNFYFFHMLTENDQKVYGLKQELESTEDAQRAQELETEIAMLEAESAKIRKESEEALDKLMNYIKMAQ